MGLNTAQVIKTLSLEHINKGNLLMGQCLTAVGWVGGTIPELPDHPNIIELSMADVAGGGIAVGSSLFGKRSIYVVRYQGFLWYNLPSVVNYAAKSKEMWGISCPLIIRAIAMEGKIGPVAGSSHHSLAYRMPGIRIASPMTPEEYKNVWFDALSSDDPYLISEHRLSYSIDYETEDIIHDKADLTIIPISATRFNVLKAIKSLDIKINFKPLVFLKPLLDFNNLLTLIKNSKYGAIILDDDYTDGIAKTLAYDLMLNSNKSIHVMGLKSKSAGFSDLTDNLLPSVSEIVTKILGIVNE